MSVLRRQFSGCPHYLESIFVLYLNILWMIFRAEILSCMAIFLGVNHSFFGEEGKVALGKNLASFMGLFLVEGTEAPWAYG